MKNKEELTLEDKGSFMVNYPSLFAEVNTFEFMLEAVYSINTRDILNSSRN